MSTISEAIRAAAMAKRRAYWLGVLGSQNYFLYTGALERLDTLSDSQLRWFLLFVACALED